MIRLTATRVSALLAASAAVLLASGSPAAPAAARHYRQPGAGEVVLTAGQSLRGEHDSPEASVDAGIADLESASDQQRYAQDAAKLPGMYPTLKWNNVGPFGQDDPPNYPTGGIRFARNAGMGAAVEVDPRDASGNSVYIGNMGGIWHTTDGGATWTNLSDGKLTRGAVGAIAVDPAKPTDLYVGTGIGLLTISGDAPGSGIWVSHDAGKTFTRPAANIKGYAVNDLAVTKGGVLAATNNGLYYSTDHGGSFHRVALPDNAGHTAPATGGYANWISALAVSPINDLDVVAAVGMGYGTRLGPDGKPLSPGNGLYESKTGVAGPYTFMPGTSQLKNSASSVDPVGRIALSWRKAASGDSTVLWALVTDAGYANAHQPGGAPVDTVSTTTGHGANVDNTVLNGLYRSDDGGTTWDVKATAQSLTTDINSGLGIYPLLGYGPGVQGYYNLWVDSDPRNPAEVFFGLEEVYQSVQPTHSGPGIEPFEIVQRYWDVCGSTTYLENIFTGVSCPDPTPYYGGTSTHPDQHTAAIATTPNGIRLYTGNDGGFFRQDSHALTDGNNAFDNRAWTDMNKLATVQPWHVARKPDGEFLTALQDNGGGFFAPGGQSTLVSSGDGVNAVASPDPDTWYLSAQGAVIYVTTDHGKTIREIQPNMTAPTFLSPLAIDPTDENHLVVGEEVVHETTLGPNTKTVLDPLLYTVVTTDWTDSYDAGKSPVSGKAYQSQAVAVRGAAVYNGICGLCRNSLGDPTQISTTVATNVKPGCTAAKAKADCWHTAAGKGLPHSSIWNIAIDPTDVNSIYVTLNNNSLIGLDPKVVGTQRVMVSHDAGEHFTDLTGNLPKSNARDIVVRGNQLIVSTDNGVFVAPKTGQTWSRIGYGLPQVRVNDLDLDPTGRYLTAGVFGRGVWVLDFQAKAPSSSGPGPKGEPEKPVAVGDRVATTGMNGALGGIALLLLATAVAVRVGSRRRGAAY
jgi:photosystem II stability/assembly factor-like uncharacterized protein